ncbi:MAG TPA: WD40 repeat domain-containing protein, partial [Chloroflexaceae bacterium]|nr:WD40 repeat domain-containing protein [Chloroflexaceae bacterium]
LLLVIDQFEELFTLAEDEAERAHLLDSIVTAVLDERSRLRVVVTLRADFIDRPLQYVDFGELLRQRAELVLPLTPEEVERAVVGPARRAGLVLEEGLAARIIADVGGQPGVLPLLQHALNELFARREGRALTLAAYRAIGGVTGALARSAEAIFDGLDGAAQDVARHVFLRLVTPGEGTEDTRRRARRSELAAAGPPQAVAAVIDVFGQGRLLTFDHDPATREPTVEVAHEALLREWPRLRGWVDAARAELRAQRQLEQVAGEWASGGHDPSYLARGARLMQFVALADSGAVRLGGRERAYLDASLAAQATQEQDERERAERELRHAQALAEEQRARADEQVAAARQLRRRAWLLAAALAITAVAALAALGLAGRNAALADERARAAATAQAAEGQAVAAQATAQAERDRAETEADIASARAFAASALNSLSADPERSILLGLHALDQADIPEVHDALHQAILGSRVRRTLRGHTDEVWAVAFSSDGALLASGGADGAVKLWDVANGQELRTLRGHTAIVYRVAFSPDGALLASAGEDGAAIVWEVATGAVLHTMAEGMDVVSEVVFSPDGTLLATDSAATTVQLWDARSGRPLRTMAASGTVDGLAFSPDGQQLAAGGEDGVVFVWDVATGEERERLQAHDNPIIDLAFSPDGALLAVAGFDGVARVLERATQETRYSLTSHTSVLGVILFTPDGSRIITSSQDGTAKIWEAATGRELFTISGHTGAGSIYGVAVTPGCVEPPAAPFAWCGTTLATASRDHTVKLWDLSPEGQQELLLVPGVIAAFDAQGTELRTAGYSDDNQAIVQRWHAAELWKTSAFRPPRTTVTTGGAAPEELQLSTAGSVLGFALSPDGTRLAKGSDDGTVTVWDAADGSELLTLTGLTGRVESVAFSPDGGRLAAASFDTFAKVWDVASGEEQLTLRGHTSQLVGIAFSADGRMLATGAGEDDNTAKVWDAATGEERMTFSGHSGGVVPVAFSPDGSLLATGSRDGTARLWDVATGEELLVLRGHTAALRSIAFSPDGQLLATGSGDATLRIWDIAEGPGRGRNLLILRGHRASVRSIAFSPDGAEVASGSRDGTVRIYALGRQILVALARARLTRTWTEQECLQYLRAATCPAAP